MRYKTHIFVSFAMIIALAANGQLELRLVSAMPFHFVGRYPTAKTIVYKVYNNSELDTAFVLSWKDSLITTFLYLNNEQKFMAMHQEHLENLEDQVLSVVDLRFDSVITYKLNSLPFKVRNPLFINSLSKTNMVVLHYLGEGYFGFSTKTEKVPILDPEFQKLVVVGNSGLALNNNFVQPLSNDEGHLKLSLRPYEQALNFYQDTADLKLFKKKGAYRYYYGLGVCTDSFKVIIGYNSIPKKDSIGKIGVIIKAGKMKWYYHEFKGGITAPIAFGNWLAGNVADYNRGYYSLSQNNPIYYNFSRPLPGKEVRRPLFFSISDEDKYRGESENFDQRAASIGYYYPGILFAYNALTKKYIEWKTGQADSEVLLVCDQMIWYRIDDQLFSATIGDSMLEGITLILKDDRVRDIHWAYVKPRM